MLPCALRRQMTPIRFSARQSALQKIMKGSLFCQSTRIVAQSASRFSSPLGTFAAQRRLSWAKYSARRSRSRLMQSLLPTIILSAIRHRARQICNSPLPCNLPRKCLVSSSSTTSSSARPIARQGDGMCRCWKRQRWECDCVGLVKTRRPAERCIRLRLRLRQTGKQQCAKTGMCMKVLPKVTSGKGVRLPSRKQANALTSALRSTT